MEFPCQETLHEKWSYFNALLISPAHFNVEFVVLSVIIIVIASAILYQAK